MEEAYYLDGSRNQQGPVPVAEIARLIRSGTIRRDTLVWTAGMPDWRQAGQLNGFASFFSASAPPPPPPASPPPQAFAAPAVATQRRIPMAGPYSGQAPQAQARPTYGSSRDMGFGGAIATCFRKYVDFTGRARRAEFWWWTLFNALVALVLTGADIAISGIDGPDMLSKGANIALFLPSLAVGVRRLHDTDRSGWWQLLWFIPLIGWIVMIVFMCLRGTEGSNRFGPDPLGPDPLGHVAAEFD